MLDHWLFRWLILLVVFAVFTAAFSGHASAIPPDWSTEFCPVTAVAVPSP